MTLSGGDTAFFNHILLSEFFMVETDYNFRLKDCLIGAQMLLVAFGSLVLVPLLTGLSSNVALFTAGVGTLLFQFVTKGKVPIFLASSFAFITPIIYGVKTWGLPATMGALVVTGFVYVILSLIIRFRGSDILMRFLPPLVTGPVIVVIGLSLAPVAVNMAIGVSAGKQVIPYNVAISVAMISLATTMLVSLLGKGLIRLLPILCGIATGWIAATFCGLNDFSKVIAAPWFAVPDFTFPQFSWEATFFIVPVVFATAIEHVGDILAISGVTGKNYLADPGIKTTLLGDGLASMLACFLGGPPNTTYSEVTGAVTLTRSFNPAIMTWAAITAILLSFVAKLGALLASIPMPVMGGIMILLFGAITVVGLNTLVKSQKDLTESRNMIIVAVILVFGIGGMFIGSEGFRLSGIGLSAVTGIILNLILPNPRHK